MKLFDTHAHLTDDAFDNDREQLIDSIKAQNMLVLNCGYDQPSCENAVELAAQYPFFYAAVGMHPHDADSYNDQFEQDLRRWLQQEKTVALGEIGLDYHYDYSPRETQRELFIRQLKLAAEMGKPVMIHSREASQDTYDILEKHMDKNCSGVMHSFSQSTEMMHRYLDLGMMFSISGIVTFKNATHVRETVSAIPLDRLMVETDCPYMTPVPFRGKRNEPPFVRYVAETVAQLKQIPTDKLCEVTYRNALNFFDIPEK